MFASASQWFTPEMMQGSLALIFVALLLGSVGLPLPEDLLLLGAGALVFKGGAPLWLALPVCAVGVITGDLIIYGVARKLGRMALRRRPFRSILTPRRRQRIRRMFDRYGGAYIFVARHVAGLRSATFAMAGIHRMPLRKFLAWDLLGICVSVPIMIGLGYFFSDRLEWVSGQIDHVEYVLLGIVAVVAVVWITHVIVSRRQETQEIH